MPVIATNTAANSALRYLNLNASQESSITSKLASGSRITKASDDAAGLAIGTRIQSDVTVLSQASTNASQAIAIYQTADGGLARIGDILQRMKSLATQSNSGSVTDSERTYIDAEYQELLDEIDGIASSTRYNGVSLLDGDSSYSSSSKVGSVSYDSTATFNTSTANAITVSYKGETDTAAADLTITIPSGTALTLQQIADAINADTTTNNGKVSAYVESANNTQSLVLVAADPKATVAASATASTVTDGTTVISFTARSTGIDVMVGTDTNDTINLAINDVDSTALRLNGTSVGTQANAVTAVKALDKAIGAISSARASVGATMSRFDFRAQTIDTSQENLSAAQSAVMDADVASEKSKLSSADVKSQAAIAALTQANQMPQNLLSLLKS